MQAADEPRVREIAAYLHTLLQALGLDLNDPNLTGTRQGRDIHGVIEHIRAGRLRDIRLDLDVYQEHPRQVVLASVGPVSTGAA